MMSRFGLMVLWLLAAICGAPGDARAQFMTCVSPLASGDRPGITPLVRRPAPPGSLECGIHFSLRVLFASSSTALDKAATEELDRLVKFVGSRKLPLAYVIASVDDLEAQDRARAEALGTARTRAVIDYLTAHGLDAARLGEIGLPLAWTPPAAGQVPGLNTDMLEELDRRGVDRMEMARINLRTVEIRSRNMPPPPLDHGRVLRWRDCRARSPAHAAILRIPSSRARLHCRWR